MGIRILVSSLIFTLIVAVKPVFAATSIYVDTEWLAKHKNDQDVVVVDMSDDYLQYQRFHIPGAIRLNYGLLVKQRKDKVSVRISDEELLKLLGQHGISADDHVVIYDDLGGMNAARLFWELEKIGHKKISVLNGGLVKWILEGRKVDNQIVKVSPKKYIAGKGGINNNALMSDVQNELKDKSVVFLDVRTEDEYIGYKKYPRSGHIPGAFWWPWDKNVNIPAGFIQQPPDKISEKLASFGVKDRKQPLVLYCRTGHRASHGYLTLRALGYENVRVYDGSMAEYVRTPSNPVKQGSLP